MERKKKRLIAGLTVTGVLAGALAWGGVTVASAGTAQPGTAVTAATASTAAQEAGTAGTARLLRLERAGKLVVTTAATYDGLTPAQLRAQLKAGQSLAAIATAKGKSVSGLENAIELALINRIDDSKLSVARKAALVTDVKDYLNAFVNAPHPFASLRGAARALGKHAGTKATATPTATPTSSASTAAA
jgi:hypothetical protein